jgi:hypothetical protein
MNTERATPIAESAFPAALVTSAVPDGRPCRRTDLQVGVLDASALAGGSGEQVDDDEHPHTANLQPPDDHCQHIDARSS